MSSGRVCFSSLFPVPRTQLGTQYSVNMLMSEWKGWVCHLEIAVRKDLFEVTLELKPGRRSQESRQGSYPTWREQPGRGPAVGKSLLLGGTEKSERLATQADRSVRCWTNGFPSNMQ